MYPNKSKTRRMNMKKTITLIALSAVFALILYRLAHEDNKCVIIVTHSENVSAIADEVIGIRAGSLLNRDEYQAGFVLR